MVTKMIEQSPVKKKRENLSQLKTTLPKGEKEFRRTSIDTVKKNLSEF